MNIQANNLYAEMQALASQATGQSIRPNNDLPAMNPLSADVAINNQNSQLNQPAGQSFADLLSKAVNNVNDLQQNAGTLKNAVEMGDRSVSLAEAMIASQKAGIAFEATVQVRNKLVEAYKSIMSMPV